MLIPERYNSPQNLVLEQVHLYVRHGKYVCLLQRGLLIHGGHWDAPKLTRRTDARWA